MQSIFHINDNHKYALSEGGKQKLSAALLVLAGLSCCFLLVILSKGM